jgi:hypothetical protein
MQTATPLAPGDNDLSRLAGQAFIGERWACLASRTRMSLRRTGSYDEPGRRLEPKEGGHGPYEEVERLEDSLGILRACAEAGVTGTVIDLCVALQIGASRQIDERSSRTRA